MQYKTTRFQWVCVTLMFWGFLLFLAWFFQAFFDYRVRLRAVTGICPFPAPAATTNVAIADGVSAGRLLAPFSSSVRGLLAQNAAPPAAPPAAADTAVVPFGAVLAPVWGVMAPTINAFGGLCDTTVLRQVVSGGLTA
ncbi:hypothetical protein THAR02_04942 [Trichoderma harzianum]|uniref:Uncharacterized protein n=1 Tax=Trichoderma harzianum TaxID=5544 RepID=A0A0F9XEH6_TRIHA|nr:hypothetical protein THAR02_04942 [Trichoderma harzianum]